LILTSIALNIERQASSFEILIKCNLLPNQIQILYENTSLKYPKQAEDYITLVWKETSSSRPDLYDGRLYHVTSYNKQDNDQLCLNLINTSYKYFVGTRDDRFISRFGTAKISNPLSVGVTLFTSDDKTVIGKRKKNRHIRPGMFGLISGAMEQKDNSNGIPDPVLTARRELREEIGVYREDIIETVCVGLIFDKELYQTFMPFRVRTTLDSHGLSKREPEEHEFDEFFFLDSGDSKTLDRFLKENISNLSQTAIASMLLCGIVKYIDP
jgi:8-oxo-dGTP pyrophosphatase MutT (NUDIX family)